MILRSTLWGLKYQKIKHSKILIFCHNIGKLKLLDEIRKSYVIILVEQSQVIQQASGSDFTDGDRSLVYSIFSKEWLA